MKRRDLELYLKQYGFELIRETKHRIFSNGVKTISLPFNRFVTMGLAKRIMLQAQGRNFQTNTARQ